ncbi:MAG TPA: hypothetical protein VHF01_13810 [Candidatus Acidoferrum sp.]|nr:hypothetical protein [Candidatus Acidoferrum sp.]
MDDLIALIEKLKAGRRFSALDEAATKQGIVLPLLSKLGWDCFDVDEVSPEYAVAGRRVDFALRIGNKNKAFLEVKKPSEDLDKHQEQLLDYSFKEGVKLAILSNGLSWWFYLPLNEGSWEQRKFYTVDLEEQPAKDIALRFLDFLSRSAVENGKALDNAETVYKSQRKTKVIREALPLAFHKLLAESNDAVIEILSEITEKMCGYKPDAEIVAEFLRDSGGRPESPRPSLESSHQVRSQSNRPNVQAALKAYTGTTIDNFSFRGKGYPVKSWIELLLNLCQLLLTIHGRDFERCLTLEGRKRPYFSRNSDVLRLPKKIADSDVYVETNLSANSIVKLCLDLIALFGYQDSDLVLHYG